MSRSDRVILKVKLVLADDTTHKWIKTHKGLRPTRRITTAPPTSRLPPTRIVKLIATGVHDNNNC